MVMQSTRRLGIAVIVLLALSLAASAAVAGQDCKLVNANVKSLSPFWTDPAECDGYDFCQYAELKGTLNGLWWVWGYWADWEDAAGGAATVLAIDKSVVETNRGDLYTLDIEMLNNHAPDGFVFHDLVTGGTGFYEGATGWIAGWISFVPREDGKIGGRICWDGD